MSKITSEQSRKIYTLVTAPDRKMSNVEIGKKFGISERSVRHHIKKWEKQVHTMAQTNRKVASALVNHVVDVHTEAVSILEAVKAGIQEAKVAGVSPEKLAPLYTNWIKSLELASELIGKVVIKTEVVRQDEFDIAELVLQDQEIAEHACKLFERITVYKEQHKKIQRPPPPNLKSIEEDIMR